MPPTPPSKLLSATAQEILRSNERLAAKLESKNWVWPYRTVGFVRRAGSMRQHDSFAGIRLLRGKRTEASDYSHLWGQPCLMLGRGGLTDVK